jgi:hypothetical protein
MPRDLATLLPLFRAQDLPRHRQPTPAIRGEREPTVAIERREDLLEHPDFLLRVVQLAHEGHPLLWYLLLHLGHAVLSSRLILPLVSLAVAVGTVALLILRSPLPLWLKALFLFGRMPLYECSVMARNYGLSILLLFTFAWQ